MTSDNDCYLDIKHLSKRSSVPIKVLEDSLRHPVNPLPHYTIDGHTVVSWHEFKDWMEQYRIYTGVFSKQVDSYVREAFEL